MKDNWVISGLVASLLAFLLFIAVFTMFYTVDLTINKKLSNPEKSSGVRGELFGIDKNINEKTIDNYLGRSDTVYRDMRMLKDPANYEAIKGDSDLTGFIKGFEVIPLPFLVNVDNLPEAVGKTYEGKTLFTKVGEKYNANYEESLKILEYYFPKDKNIFLMCGGGGYAFETKKLLISLGWDKDKLYNVGAYWSYEGKNNVDVKRKNKDGTYTYDFWKVIYHDINFESLKELTNETK